MTEMPDFRCLECGMKDARTLSGALECGECIDAHEDDAHGEHLCPPLDKDAVRHA